MDIYYRIGYGLMIAAIVMVLVLSRKHIVNLRIACDRFAIIYCQIANHICPKKQNDFKLRVISNKQTGELSYKIQDQTRIVTECLNRARDEELVEAFSELGEAFKIVETKAGYKKKLREQFVIPLQSLYESTYFFLNVSNEQMILHGQEEVMRFNDYIRNQTEARIILFKRISSAASETFMSLNEEYRDVFLNV